MSAILDALKKSETDRKKGSSPDFASAQMLMTGRKQKLSLWVWLVITLLLINLLAITVFFIYNQDVADNTVPQSQSNIEDKEGEAMVESSNSIHAALPTDNVAPQSTPLKEVEETSDAALAQRAAKIAYSQEEIEKPETEALEEQFGSAKLPGVMPSISEKEFSQEASEPEFEDNDQIAVAVPYLNDMDRSFQQQIPNLVFNSHIYASNASRRRIMINNEYLSQGQKIEGLVIEEITPDGVVLSKDGTPFKLSVVRNWSFQ